LVWLSARRGGRVPACALFCFRWWVSGPPNHFPPPPPPPNKVAKRPAFELSCQTELVTYKAKARVSLFEARAFSLLWVLAKRYHVGLYAIAGYSRWQASMTLGPFLGGVGNEKT